MNSPCYVSVLVPSYRRPEALLRCLLGLRNQSLPPKQVLVIVRPDDVETNELLVGRSELPKGLHTVHSHYPGVVAAMNAGLAAATGDCVALIDDDAVPAGDWLERLLALLYSTEDVGGVGGRDRVIIEGREETGTARIVGKLHGWGRVTGNHHLGTGPAREVDVLKGVNCAFRREALAKIGFDRRMRGAGAQVHWELALCLALKRAGWKLLYDPAIQVDHFPAIRHDPDQRGTFVPAPCRDAVHNETLALLEHFGPSRRLIFLAWAFLIGTRGAPGLAQIPRLWLQGERAILSRLQATWSGRRQGLATWRRSRHSGVDAGQSKISPGQSAP